jgi:hypothetical protein
MSWDVLITKYSRAYDSFAAIPHSEKPQVIGARSMVHRQVSDAFPEVDWTDPAWGVWMSPSGSIEFNLGEVDPALTMMLHVRAGVEVVPLIVRLCVANNWQGMDCSSGDFIERRDDPRTALNGWLAYRDKIKSLAKS